MHQRLQRQKLVGNGGTLLYAFAALPKLCDHCEGLALKNDVQLGLA